MNSVKARRSVSRTPMVAGVGVALALLVALPAAASGVSENAEGVTVGIGSFGERPSATADALASVTTGPNVTVAIEDALAKSKARQERADRRAAAKEKANQASSGSQSSGSGKYIPTSNYNLSAMFGQSGGWSSGYHTGTDFAAPIGTPVVAAMSGTVISAGWDGSYGQSIVIENADGTQSRYAHLSQIGASAGQQVSGGQVIGNVGSTGNSSGPHLHFEVSHGDGWSGGQFIDPLGWLNS